MLIGSQTINGIFEWISDVIYTKGDIVFKDGRLFSVKKTVIDIDPITDDTGNYEDYVESKISEKNYLTKDKLNDYLGKVFAGLSTDGVTPDTNITNPQNFTTSGFYQIGNSIYIVIIDESNGQSQNKFVIEFTKDNQNSVSFVSAKVNDAIVGVSNAIVNKLTLTQNSINLINGDIEMMVSDTKES